MFMEVIRYPTGLVSREGAGCEGDEVEKPNQNLGVVVQPDVCWS